MIPEEKLNLTTLRMTPEWGSVIGIEFRPELG